MTTDQGCELDLSERVRLMRDGLINNSAFLVSGLVGILLVPIMLQGLGAELYGLWIAAQAVAAIVALVEPGLGWSVAREVSATGGDEIPLETARFVTTAGGAYLVVGIVGAALIGTLGLPMSGSLHLSAAVRNVAPSVFVLVGLAFFADQLLSYPLSILSGARRFDATNFFCIVAALLRAGGIIVLLGAGMKLVAVATWTVVVTVVTACLALGSLRRLEPRLLFRAGGFDWGSFRSRLPFGLTSQLTTAANSILWQMAPILIGLVHGSAAIVPYHIGQKFPLARISVLKLQS